MASVVSYKLATCRRKSGVHYEIYSDIDHVCLSEIELVDELRHAVYRSSDWVMLLSADVK